MSVHGVKESVVEAAALGWFAELGYEVIHGPDIAPGEPEAERESYGQVVLSGRLQAALSRINPEASREDLAEAQRKVELVDIPSLAEANHDFHRLLTEGVDVEYQRPDGTVSARKVRLVDTEDPANNDWAAVNQFTVIENGRDRRLDIVVFVNGLPLGVLELKNPGDEDATLGLAYNQLQTYKRQIPSLFAYNEILTVSDGLAARTGTLTASREWFLPWRTVTGEEDDDAGRPELEVAVKGVYEKSRLLDLVMNFVVFEGSYGGYVKKMAAYHQFHAVNKALDSTLEAASAEGDRRAGVVWHTQGSGKSLSMAFYAGKIVRARPMENPTLVILTDRNDLDDQLFGTFSECAELLRQSPVQAESRDHLRELLRVASGGVVFTTIQKFMPNKGEDYPLLSERRNIVFVADEAHRSQYDFIDGFARHMRDALPYASFVGFTGTPIEADDRSTQSVFGNYIDVYDIQQAVEDGATVPVYYEGRVADLWLEESAKPTLDPEFEEVTEGEEAEGQEKLKGKWARLEALVGSEERIQSVARDIVEHYERRREAIEGKAMIVCMSRRICVELYDAITALRPEWHDESDDAGEIKVVMTGSASDPLEWQEHVRNKRGREALAKRFKAPEDPLKLVIVRDMWLTGFDAPMLHTMYADKPMRGHGLMQAIARVNRVYKDKPGGLIVDYLGIADHLKRALASYTERDRDQAGVPQEAAVAVMAEKYEVAFAMLHNFDVTPYYRGSASERLSVLAGAMNHILGQEDGRRRFMQAVTELSKAFALAVPHEKALAIRDEVGFLQDVRASLAKSDSAGEGAASIRENLDTALGQLVSRAVASSEVKDIFSAAGVKAPEVSVLSDTFLEEVRGSEHRNLAADVLEKLLRGEIKAREKTNVVEARRFSEMLDDAITRYRNRSIETADIISQMIELARELREAHHRGEELGLSDEELAFYDALGANESAVQVLGDENLKIIARELIRTVRENATVDWTIKENARANMRRQIKRILRKHGYPPDEQQQATLTVLKQAEAIGRSWAA